MRASGFAGDLTAGLPCCCRSPPQGRGLPLHRCPRNREGLGEEALIAFCMALLRAPYRQAESASTAGALTRVYTRWNAASNASSFDGVAHTLTASLKSSSNSSLVAPIF